MPYIKKLQDCPAPIYSLDKSWIKSTVGHLTSDKTYENIVDETKRKCERYPYKFIVYERNERNDNGNREEIYPIIEGYFSSACGLECSPLDLLRYEAGDHFDTFHKDNLTGHNIGTILIFPPNKKLTGGYYYNQRLVNIFTGGDLVFEDDKYPTIKPSEFDCWTAVILTDEIHKCEPVLTGTRYVFKGTIIAKHIDFFAESKVYKEAVNIELDKKSLESTIEELMTKLNVVSFAKKILDNGFENLPCFSKHKERSQDILKSESIKSLNSRLNVAIENYKEKLPIELYSVMETGVFVLPKNYEDDLPLIYFNIINELIKLGKECTFNTIKIQRYVDPRDRMEDAYNRFLLPKLYTQINYADNNIDFELTSSEYTDEGDRDDIMNHFRVYEATVSAIFWRPRTP